MAMSEADFWPRNDFTLGPYHRITMVLVDGWACPADENSRPAGRPCFRSVNR
jgi:hypothetical protein